VAGLKVRDLAAIRIEDGAWRLGIPSLGGHQQRSFVLPVDLHRALARDKVAQVGGQGFAMESEQIGADMVEAIELPHLSNKYGVHGVPRMVINESVHQEGAVPEALLLAKLQEAVG